MFYFSPEGSHYPNEKGGKNISALATFVYYFVLAGAKIT
jgi:hypothetical protein